MDYECHGLLVVLLFKAKGDIMNCSCYGAVKFLEHGMKVVEWVFEKWLHRIVSVDEMQFGFLPWFCIYIMKAARRVSC